MIRIEESPNSFGGVLNMIKMYGAFVYICMYFFQNTVYWLFL